MGSVRRAKDRSNLYRLSWLLDKPFLLDRRSRKLHNTFGLSSGRGSMGTSNNRKDVYHEGHEEHEGGFAAKSNSLVFHAEITRTGRWLLPIVASPRMFKVDLLYAVFPGCTICRSCWKGVAGNCSTHYEYRVTGDPCEQTVISRYSSC